MKTYVALLRAVNVGGTGRLPMQALRSACTEAGLVGVRTYIASGNVVFTSAEPFQTVSDTLNDVVAELVGKPVDIFFRSFDEISLIAESSPFASAPPNQVLVNFFNETVSSSLVDSLIQRSNEQVSLGSREIFVWYPDGMGKSKMRWPAKIVTTGRNLRTVRKLADMASELP